MLVHVYVHKQMFVHWDLDLCFPVPSRIFGLIKKT